MVKIEFVYRPTTGDRKVAQSENIGGLVVLQWRNGCRHIAGDFVALRYNTAEPHRHWRKSAGRLATQVAEIIPGVFAWDAQGILSLLCPPSRVGEVDGLFKSVRGFNAPEEDERNLASAFAAEAAKVVDFGWRNGGGGLALHYAPRETSVSFGEPRLVEGEEGKTRVLLSYLEGDVKAELSFTVPAGWRLVTPELTPEPEEDSLAAWAAQHPEGKIVPPVAPPPPYSFPEGEEPA